MSILFSLTVTLILCGISNYDAQTASNLQKRIISKFRSDFWVAQSSSALNFCCQILFYL